MAIDNWPCDTVAACGSGHHVAGDQIQHPIVSRDLILRFGCQTGVGEVAQGAHTIGDAHNNHALAGQPLTGGEGTSGGSSNKAATVDPDHHRQPLAGRLGRSPDVEIQAVFAAASARGPAALLRFGFGRCRSRSFPFRGALGPNSRGRSAARASRGESVGALTMYRYNSQSPGSQLNLPTSGACGREWDPQGDAHKLARIVCRIVTN